MNEELKIIIKAVTDEAKKQLDGVKKELQDIGKEGSKAGKSVNESLATLKKGALATVGTIVALTAALVNLGKASDEFRIAMSKVNATFESFGSNATQAGKTFQELYRFLGDNDRAAETAQSLALITTEEAKLSEWTHILQGAFAAMGDKLPIEGLAEAANETIKVGQVTGVLADALNWMGVSEDAFNQALAQTNSLSEREALLRATLNGLYSNSATLYERNNSTALRLNESQYKLNVALANTAKYTLPLRTELNILSTVLMTMLAPAIQVVCAYLTAFIQLIVGAIQWVGSFFNIFGSSTEKSTADFKGYKQAIDDYTGSLRDSFNATTNGGEEAIDTIQKLKRQTMGFDELNILASPNASTTGANTGSTGGGGGGDSFAIPDMPSPEDFDIGGDMLDGFQEKIDSAKQTLKILLGLAAAAGLVFAGWKLTNFIKDIKLMFTPFKKLKEELGDDFKKVIDDASARLDTIQQKLISGLGLAAIIGGVILLVNGIKDFINNGYSMEAVLTILGGAILVVVGAILLFNASLLANPITWIVIAIMALVAGFVILWNECEGFRNFWIELWDGIKKVWNAFVKSIQPLIDAIVGAFKEGWELVKVVFALAWAAIKVVWNGVKPYFEMIWENIKIIFSVVKEVLGAYFKLAWEYIKAVWDVVIAYFTAIWNTIAGVFSVVKNVLSGNWQEAWDAIKGIVDGWAKYFETTWKSIKKVFAAVKDFFKTTFNAAWEGIKAIFNNVSGFFQRVWDKVKNIFSKAAKGIGDAVSKAFSSAINWVLEKAIGIINGFIGAINTAISVINAIPGVSITKLKKLDVPKLATGGIVDSATIAMVGERGKEAVLPLENNTEWMDMLAEKLNGNAPTKLVMQVDGKTFGEVSIDSINGITKQSGKLQLVLA